MKEIKVKYHNPDLIRLSKIEVGDWIDLRAAEEVFVPVHSTLMPTLISLGVSMELPEGYEAIIAPRSSTYNKFGLIQTNSIGIIDNSYSGDNDVWKFPCICLQAKECTKNGEYGVTIHVNDRICQFRIQKRMEDVTFVEVNHLGNADRGGFGSTGTN